MNFKQLLITVSITVLLWGMSQKGLLKKVKQLFIDFLQELSSPWWAEISTINPKCIYYFGPFETSSEVKNAYPGYVNDLDSEGAQGVVVIIKRCKPDILTIFNE